MAGYSAANLDDIVAEKWPYWAPIRYHFDIRSFGASAWRGGPGDDVIKKHNEGPGGHEELYIVLSGHATFTVDGDEIDAATGMCVHIPDPTIEREAVATEAGTVVLSLGAWPDKAFEPSEWELASFAE
jgi:hypothetical protein